METVTLGGWMMIAGLVLILGVILRAFGPEMAAGTLGVILVVAGGVEAGTERKRGAD
jgi:hypothetical protein